MLFDDCGVENNASWRLPPELPAANKLTIGTMALIAQNERETISARKARGLPARQSGRSDTHCGRSWLNCRQRRQVCEADKRAADLAPVIADIQAMGAVTCAAIAAELNARGFPAPRGGRWAPAQVFSA